MKIKRRPSIKKLSPRKKHKKWQIQEAKAKFSQLIKETTSSGYQTITKNGEPVAYIVSKEEFEIYLKPQKSLLEVLDQCPYPEIDLDITRRNEKIREPNL
jgi:prevent-host-death family protein